MERPELKQQTRQALMDLAAAPKTDTQKTTAEARVMLNACKNAVVTGTTAAKLANSAAMAAESTASTPNPSEEALANASYLTAKARALEAAADARRSVVEVHRAIAVADERQRELDGLTIDAKPSITEIDAAKKAISRAKVAIEGTLTASLRALECADKAEAAETELNTRIDLSIAKTQVAKVAKEVQQAQHNLKVGVKPRVPDCSDAFNHALRAASGVIAVTSGSTSVAVNAARDALFQAKQGRWPGKSPSTLQDSTQAAAHLALAMSYTELALDLAADSSNLQTSPTASAGKQPLPHRPNPDYADLRRK